MCESIISVGKLCRDNDCIATLDAGKCYFQDKNTGDVIGIGFEEEVSYYITECTT